MQRADAGSPSAPGRPGEPFFLKPTDLGTYLLYGTERDFLGGADGGVAFAAEPSADTEWIAERSGTGFTLRHRRRPLPRRRTAASWSSPTRAPGSPSDGTDGCTAYPEAQINITGAPTAGISPYQEVRGYVDAHTHGMAFEFLGGDVHCGRPWHEYGAPYALVDCPDHTATGGNGAALEALLSGRPTHDPVGWPTFKDWPAPESLTHEGTYYRWLERSWRGGQRVFVNLLVENNQLCQLYPIKHNSCDDMDSVRLQAKDMSSHAGLHRRPVGRARQGLLPDRAQPVGGPARDQRRARWPSSWASRPACPSAARSSGSPVATSPSATPPPSTPSSTRCTAWGCARWSWSTSSTTRCRASPATTARSALAVNTANFLETNSFWDMRHCEPEHPDAHDKNQLAAPDISAGQQDALFGAVAELFGAVNLPALPLYGTPDHCNARGLTTLGEHTIAGLAKRHMLFDPDHMSVKARNAALDQVEEMEYPGILSSHSWSTEDAYPRIYELGGYIAPYAGDSTGFVEKWRKHLGWADPRYYFGFGYGADMNGLGAQGNPRGADVPNPVEYPFTGMGGVTVDKQRAGERVYDINVDGVAQYGLYPDWIEDLRQVAGGATAARSSTTWPAARRPTSRRGSGPRASRPTRAATPSCAGASAPSESQVRRGMSTRQVMEAVGQPYTRLGNRSTFCARTATNPRVLMTVTYTDAGTVTGLQRS